MTADARTITMMSQMLARMTRHASAAVMPWDVPAGAPAAAGPATSGAGPDGWDGITARG